MHDAAEPNALRWWPLALRVARKEFRAFFASPAAYLFLAAFAAAVLFSFFWVDTFFARNIADVRPLFRWLPLLLIFLVAALTMRSWSDERRGGTLESLLTAPVAPWSLVLGKFAAVLALVALALALTLPLPVTVALLGPLDWGPVIGGYVKAMTAKGFPESETTGWIDYLRSRNAYWTSQQVQRKIAAATGPMELRPEALKQ